MSEECYYHMIAVLHSASLIDPLRLSLHSLIHRRPSVSTEPSRPQSLVAVWQSNKSADTEQMTAVLDQNAKETSPSLK